MIRALIFLTLASAAWAQVLLPPESSTARPKVFSITPGVVTPVDQKPAIATAKIEPAPELPALQVLSDGWELKEIAHAGDKMDDGFARPVGAQALGVIEGPGRGQLTLMSTHRDGVVQLSDVPSGKRPVSELIFNPKLMMSENQRALDGQNNVPASVTRTVVDVDGKIVRQEMALLGALTSSGGALTADGKFLVGETAYNQPFCPVGMRPMGHFFAVQAGIAGLDAPKPLNYAAKLSFDAIAVDETGGNIYIGSGNRIYRWRPNVWKDLSLGGKLMVLWVDKPAGSLAEADPQLNAGKEYKAHWDEVVRDSSATSDDLKSVNTNVGQVRGLTLKNGELWISADKLMVLKASGISVFVSKSNENSPREPGVLTSTPTGELLVVDNASSSLVLLTREGAWKPLFKANSAQGQRAAQITGVGLSPDGKWIFLNLESGKNQPSLAGLKRQN